MKKRSLFQWSLIAGCGVAALWLIILVIDRHTCHTFEQMAQMYDGRDLSDCDRQTLHSLSIVLTENRAKEFQFQRYTESGCNSRDLVIDFKKCTIPYLRAIRAEAMLDDHTATQVR